MMGAVVVVMLAIETGVKIMNAEDHLAGLGETAVLWH
jgi:hypothetical protein